MYNKIAMAVVKIKGMSRSVADFFILLFIYAVYGTPLGDKPQSREIKYGYLAYYTPESFGKEADVTFYWPRGVVQYFVNTSSYDDMLKDKLRVSMKLFEKDSCVRFEEIKEKPGLGNRGSWLHITNENKERRCVHKPVPRENGEIQLILGYDCLKQSDITHALMHGLGFRDEVTHPKRDSYIKIMWNNIQPAYWTLFGRYAMDDPELLSEYDPKSVMHFHDHAFSVNGKATISGLIPGLKIAPSDNLSHLDKMKLGVKFGHECNKRKVGELLDTCQDIFSKNKTGSWDDAEALGTKTQNGSVISNRIYKNEHNDTVSSGNKNPPEPDINDGQSEDSDIPHEPRMDFDSDSGGNGEISKEKDQSIPSNDGEQSDRSVVGSNTDKMNSDEHNVIILGRGKAVSSKTFNVDPPAPENDDGQMEDNDISQEPPTAFDSENGRNDESSDDNQSDRSVIGSNTGKINNDEHNVIILGRDKAVSSKTFNDDDQREDNDNSQELPTVFDSENGRNDQSNDEKQLDKSIERNNDNFHEIDSKASDEGNEDGTDKKSDVNLGSDNNKKMNIVVIGHDSELRTGSKNVVGKNYTKFSRDKNVKQNVKMTRELADFDTRTDNVSLKEDKIKLAYADIADTSVQADPEDSKKKGGTNDNSNSDENDANNTDDNKVI